ncbi:unnamed protein product [Rotaria socialis]|uniref:Uncharacterized protein n=1 Tax=Rotaria socialis TaxID=392032 RepID=A0A821X6I3_9BILA|nr:unnamed protein product [Rotaria socialis]CAF4935332.1 unnamed protein product [Rotaria socialis]
MNHTHTIIPPISEEVIKEPNISEPNIEIPPVASNEPIIILEEIIINPIPVAVPTEPTIDNNLPSTVRNNSQIPVLSPVLNPTITRLPTSNLKPKGFYKT